MDELVRGHGRALAELSHAIATRVIALEAEGAAPTGATDEAAEASEAAEAAEPKSAW